MTVSHWKQTYNMCAFGTACNLTCLPATFSGGGTGRDFECFQGGSGDLSVQRQPQHQNWGAGLWDGYQMDQAGLKSQSAGNKNRFEPSALVCVSVLCCSALQQARIFVSWEQKKARWKHSLPLTIQTLGVYRAELLCCDCSINCTCLHREVHRTL